MGGGAQKESGNFFSPLIICMTATCLAIVAYHLVVVKYCLTRRRQLLAEAILARHNLAEDFPLGVEERILRTIPIFTYSSEKAGPADLRADQKEYCAVCLGELEEEESVRMLPGCRHVFHVQCIDRWFLAKSSCPVCRSPVRAGPAVEEGRVSECVVGDAAGRGRGVVTWNCGAKTVTFYGGWVPPCD